MNSGHKHKWEKLILPHENTPFEEGSYVWHCEDCKLIVFSVECPPIQVEVDKAKEWEETQLEHIGYVFDKCSLHANIQGSCCPECSRRELCLRIVEEIKSLFKQKPKTVDEAFIAKWKKIMTDYWPTKQIVDERHLKQMLTEAGVEIKEKEEEQK